MPPEQIISNLTWTHIDEDLKDVHQFNKEDPFKDIKMDDDDKTPKLMDDFFKNNW